MLIRPVQLQMPNVAELKNSVTADTLVQSSETTTQTASDKQTGEQKRAQKSTLSSSERQQVNELQQRDSEVRAHEAAHIAAGGSAVSGSASFTYQKGPDGKLYAIGGEVPIRIAGGSTPEERIANARQVQAGALAPANPSPQDLKVAASAAVMEAKARQELSQIKSDEARERSLQLYSKNQSSKDQDVDDGSISITA